MSEDQELSVNERFHPPRDVPVGDFVDVALGILELHDEDEPHRHHGEPAEYVGNHAADVVRRALCADIAIDALEAHGLVQIGDVVHGPVALRQYKDKRQIRD